MDKLTWKMITNNIDIIDDPVTYEKLLEYKNKLLDKYWSYPYKKKIHKELNIFFKNCNNIFIYNYIKKYISKLDNCEYEIINIIINYIEEMKRGDLHNLKDSYIKDFIKNGCKSYAPCIHIWNH